MDGGFEVLREGQESIRELPLEGQIMFRVCLTKRSSAINYGSACLSLTALAIILTLFGCATSRATGELRRYAREQLQEVPTCVIGIYLWDDGAIGDVGNYAQQAGFRRGDKILSYDNTSFVNREAFVAWLEQYQGGEEVSLTVQRGRETQKLKVQCSAQLRKAWLQILETAAAGEWESCLHAVRETKRVEGTTYGLAWARTQCSQGRRFATGGRITVNEAHDYYEAVRLEIRMASVSQEALEKIRGDVIGAAFSLRDWRFPTLANDLESQYRSARERGAVADVPETRPRIETGTGTCFAARPDGVLITAYHVVKDAESIRVHLADGTVTDAKIRTFSAGTDLAVLRIDPPTPDFLPLAPAGSVGVGDQVFTMGYPVTDVLGKEPKFTDGAVSALSGVGGEASLLQISVPVQPGNSGGPLVNDRGEVVGIVTSSAAVRIFLAVTGTLPQNVNWAVKAEYVRPLFNAPTVKSVSVNREEAVQRVGRAICMVEAISR